MCFCQVAQAAQMFNVISLDRCPLRVASPVVYAVDVAFPKSVASRGKTRKSKIGETTRVSGRLEALEAVKSERR
jgi:hypothetical protein